MYVNQEFKTLENHTLFIMEKLIKRIVDFSSELNYSEVDTLTID